MRHVVARWWFAKVSPLLYGEIYGGHIFLSGSKFSVEEVVTDRLQVEEHIGCLEVGENLGFVEVCCVFIGRFEFVTSCRG